MTPRFLKTPRPQAKTGSCTDVYSITDYSSGRAMNVHITFNLTTVDLLIETSKFVVFYGRTLEKQMGWFST